MPDGAENCPTCGQRDAVRPKVRLIDEAWTDRPGRDPRLKYFTDRRADDIRPERLHGKPLEQFVDGFYCERCGRAFVAEADLKEQRRHYR